MRIGNHLLDPPLLLAPMAGVTHSAFRRLVADFGGYGALTTEMLSAPAVCNENPATSPFTKKRPTEGKVIYQVRLTGDENIPLTMHKLASLEPLAVDINLGCPAPEVKKYGGGAALFADRERLARVLALARMHWKGALTVKCRIGDSNGPWREILADRLALFENTGIEAVTVHPRFFDEKLKRHARWDLFPWIASLTRLPIIASGDIVRFDERTRALLDSGRCSALMIGRMAVVQPWIFREYRCSGPAPDIDYLDVWMRFYDYVLDDFPPEKAIGRIKEFSAYFSRNFTYSHDLYRLIQGAKDLPTLKARAIGFLSKNPEVSADPSVMGI